MDSKRKTLHQKLIDDPENEAQANDMPEPGTFPLPDYSSVKERLLNMNKVIQDFKLGDFVIHAWHPFMISDKKVVFTCMNSQGFPSPDKMNTIYVVDLEK